MEFVDIAGLVKGAADGAGLGNKFLANIRECDAIVHVVRCFDDDDVIHVDGKVDPLSDISVINFELALADMAQIERRLERLGKGRAKSNAEKEAEQGERDALAKLQESLNEGIPARLVDLTEDEWALVKDLMLLTAKPCIHAANVNEDDLADQGASNEYVKKVRENAEKEGSTVTIISAQVESELIKLDEDERDEFLADLGARRAGSSPSSETPTPSSNCRRTSPRARRRPGRGPSRADSPRRRRRASSTPISRRGSSRRRRWGLTISSPTKGSTGAEEKGVWRLEEKVDYVVGRVTSSSSSSTSK